MGRHTFSEKERSAILDKTEGKCFHCDKNLLIERQWDIDHHPVVYRDIEDQCWCWPCGTVIDVADISNLQPSCVSCNRSHTHEDGKCIYCGHTQLRIRKTYVKLILCVIISFGLGAVLGRFALSPS